MHSIVHPLGTVSSVDWLRGWEEEEMPTAEFFKGKRSLAGRGEGYPYLMLPEKKLPASMRADIGSIGQLSVGWRKIEEINT